MKYLKDNGLLPVWLASPSSPFSFQRAEKNEVSSTLVFSIPPETGFKEISLARAVDDSFFLLAFEISVSQDKDRKLSKLTRPIELRQAWEELLQLNLEAFNIIPPHTNYAFQAESLDGMKSINIIPQDPSEYLVTVTYNPEVHTVDSLEFANHKITGIQERASWPIEKISAVKAFLSNFQNVWVEESLYLKDRNAWHFILKQVKDEVDPKFAMSLTTSAEYPDRVVHFNLEFKVSSISNRKDTCLEIYNAEARALGLPSADGLEPDGNVRLVIMKGVEIQCRLFSVHGETYARLKLVTDRLNEVTEKHL